MICSATNKAGKPCQGPAIRGGVVCRRHGGSAPQVKARAAVRYELSRWTLGDPTDDPGTVLLRLVTQSRRRAEAYSLELERVVSGFDTLADALVADIWVTDANGGSHKAGEYIRGMAQLEAQERDRCANFCIRAIGAGIAERQVRLAEGQGQLLADWVRAFIADPELNLSLEVASRVASRHLRLIADSAS